MNSKYEVRWQYQRSTQTLTHPFNNEYEAEAFFDRLRLMGGLNWLSLNEVERRELRRHEAAVMV